MKPPYKRYREPWPLPSMWPAYALMVALTLSMGWVKWTMPMNPGFWPLASLVVSACGLCIHLWYFHTAVRLRHECFEQVLDDYSAAVRFIIYNQPSPNVLTKKEAYEVVRIAKLWCPKLDTSSLYRTYQT